MDHHVRDFYSEASDDTPKGNFHKVIVLHESKDIDWESISKLVPHLVRGWFELAQLSSADRIEFTRDFWLSKLPYHPKLDRFLNQFFEGLDDVGVFLTQQKYDDPYEPQLVYSIKGDRGFFRGASPASEKELVNLQETFSEYMLPEDYQAFLQIHNGFWKTTDSTGLIKVELMKLGYETFQSFLSSKEPVVTEDNKPVNPKHLVPFYESFGMPFFQCFWAEWYPQQEMGNVYYSGINNTISSAKDLGSSSESMAFPTFTDWLMFYLEQIEY